jgi:hypothetical protein
VDDGSGRASQRRGFVDAGRGDSGDAQTKNGSARHEIVIGVEHREDVDGYAQVPT